MKLVLLSPRQGKNSNKYLGSDYNVLASYGHIQGFTSKKGSVNPEQDL